MDWSSRATVMLKAAELLAGKYRHTINAATMLNMSKTCHQSEIDAACELIDFWRFNPYFMTQVYDDQPISTQEALNYIEHRPLEGFVFAISPFNFTSISGNLPTSPAVMGNAVIWKPSSSAVLPAYYIMQLLKEAGLPDGVINLVPGPGPVIGPPVLNHLDLGGVHFTGSTYVFSTIWLTIGSDIRKYFSYPRIVGETGGKDFIVAHTSAEPRMLSSPPSSAARTSSRARSAPRRRAARTCPDSLWTLRQGDDLVDADRQSIRDGRPDCDFTNFMNGGDSPRTLSRRCRRYIEAATIDPDEADDALRRIGCDDSVGFFVQPTHHREPSQPRCTRACARRSSAPSCHGLGLP